jgi:rubredoxin
MSDRVLRGSRLGSVSYESDRHTEFAPRALTAYDCASGHETTVPFAAEADIPPTWECRVCGAEALRRDAEQPEAKATKPARTHWDMLLERRTIAELEEVLAERLAALHEQQGAVKAQLKAQQAAERSKARRKSA